MNTNVDNVVSGSTSRSSDRVLGALFTLSVTAFIGATAFAVTYTPATKVQMHMDGPVFSSVEELAQSANVIVEVQAMGVVERLVDFGGEEPMAEDPADGEALKPSGLALALYAVQVEETLAGDVKPGETILVPMLDDEVINSEHVTTLQEGETYILFLSRMSAKDVKGYDTLGQDVFLPLNYNNAVLASGDGTVRLNRWILALDEKEALFEAEQLSQLETTEGRKAVESRLADLENVAVDRDEIYGIVSASR